MTSGSSSDVRADDTFVRKKGVDVLEKKKSINLSIFKIKYQIFTNKKSEDQLRHVS